MFVKVLTILLALAAIVWMLVPSRRPVIIRGREAPPPPRVPHADDLVKCDHCGIWLPARQPCNCRERV